MYKNCKAEVTFTASIQCHVWWFSNENRIQSWIVSIMRIENNWITFSNNFFITSMSCCSTDFFRSYEHCLKFFEAVSYLLTLPASCITISAVKMVLIFLSLNQILNIMKWRLCTFNNVWTPMENREQFAHVLGRNFFMRHPAGFYLFNVNKKQRYWCRLPERTT